MFMQPKPVICCAPFEVGTCEDAFFLSVVSREPHTATLLRLYQEVSRAA